MHLFASPAIATYAVQKSYKSPLNQFTPKIFFKNSKGEGAPVELPLMASLGFYRIPSYF